jgi:hypothetical protein
MRIKNNPRRHSIAYLKAHQRAFAWAEKAMIYRSADKIAEAKAAVRNVRRWVRAITMLEARRAPVAFDN